MTSYNAQKHPQDSPVVLAAVESKVSGCFLLWQDAVAQEIWGKSYLRDLPSGQGLLRSYYCV